VALVGPSGAGKSTIFNLLFAVLRSRRRDHSHRWSGHQSGDTRIPARKHSLVTQEPFLFDETIADNIALGRRDASREEIVAAARAAAADGFISELPRGYDSRIGEGGLPAFRRAAPAHRDRPRHAAQCADPSPRRSDLGARCGKRAASSGRACPSHARPDNRCHRTPPVDRAGCRRIYVLDQGQLANGAPMPSSWREAGSTHACTGTIWLRTQATRRRAPRQRADDGRTRAYDARLARLSLRDFGAGPRGPPRPARARENWQGRFWLACRSGLAAQAASGRPASSSGFTAPASGECISALPLIDKLLEFLAAPCW